MATFYVKDFVNQSFDPFVQQKDESLHCKKTLQCEKPLQSEKPTPINIIIKTLTGKCVPLQILNTKTILDLKKELYKLEEIFLEDQRYIFNGKQLENDFTINHYEISDGDTINLVLRLRGGMFHISSARKDYANISNNYIQKFQITTRMLHELKKYNKQHKKWRVKLRNILRVMLIPV